MGQAGPQKTGCHQVHPCYFLVYNGRIQDKRWEIGGRIKTEGKNYFIKIYHIYDMISIYNNIYVYTINIYSTYNSIHMLSICYQNHTHTQHFDRLLANKCFTDMVWSHIPISNMPVPVFLLFIQRECYQRLILKDIRDKDGISVWLPFLSLWAWPPFKDIPEIHL